MHCINLSECQEFISGDGAVLRELLHPDKADLALRYSLAHAVIRSGQATIPHKLKTSEVYYILSGNGIMHIDAETSNLNEGTAVYIPPHSIQFIYNPGQVDLVFLCIVDPAWKQEDEEIIGLGDGLV